MSVQANLALVQSCLSCRYPLRSLLMCPVDFSLFQDKLFLGLGELGVLFLEILEAFRIPDLHFLHMLLELLLRLVKDGSPGIQALSTAEVACLKLLKIHAHGLEELL